MSDSSEKNDDELSKSFVLRTSPRTLKRVDEARRHIEDLPSRAELMRRIIDEWLDADEKKRRDG